MKNFATLVLLCSAQPVLAQDIVFSPEWTQACLQESAGTDGNCIGTSAQQCMLDTEGGESTYGMNGCLGAEADWWDSRLNAAYKAELKAATERDKELAEQGYAPPTEAEALREMQRAWIAYRDARCTWVASQWQGGTGMGPAATGCMMQTTAEQTLLIENTVP